MTPDLQRTIEALLFLSPEPVSATELVEACDAGEAEVDRALDALEGALAEGSRGVVLRRVAGGYTLAADPIAEDAARKLLSKPRTPPAHPGPGRGAGDRLLPSARVAAGDRPHPWRLL